MTGRAPLILGKYRNIAHRWSACFWRRRQLTVARADNETGWAGIAPVKTTPTVPIAAATLDQICAGIESIDVLKIDVEGAESLVLKGASGLLRAQRIKEVFLEVNKVCMARLGIANDEPLELLHTFGYQCMSDGDGAYAVLVNR